MLNEADRLIRKVWESGAEMQTIGRDWNFNVA